jgi:YegS/Rv2252/BmrU family lipid kinase
VAARPPKTKVIVNPSSAEGRTGRDWPAIESRLRAAIGSLDATVAGGQTEIAALAAAALGEGFDRLVVVGGDGTLNAAVNGFFRDGAPIAGDAVLGHIPSGTGADFPRTLGGGRTVDEAVAILARNHARRIDIGKLTYTSDDGAGDGGTGDGGDRRTRFFINEASFGMSAAVIELSNRLAWLRRISGTLAFYSASLTKLMTHRNAVTHLKLDDQPEAAITANTVFVCNGQYAGGGMWIAPMASPDDGCFDVVIMGDLSFRDSVRLTATIYRGKHLKHPRVTAWRGNRLTARSAGAVRLEADGELLGRLPASFEIVPNALRFCCPAPP